MGPCSTRKRTMASASSGRRPGTSSSSWGLAVLTRTLYGIGGLLENAGAADFSQRPGRSAVKPAGRSRGNADRLRPDDARVERQPREGRKIDEAVGEVLW